MKQKEHETENEYRNIKEVWEKPELAVLDVENTEGGGAIDDEGVTNFMS